MVNKYPGRCVKCHATVPANGGELRKSKAGRFYVLHLTCADGGEGVNAFTFSSGETFIRNKRGRCEDAPCCGCCTI